MKQNTPCFDKIIYWFFKSHVSGNSTPITLYKQRELCQSMNFVIKLSIILKSNMAFIGSRLSPALQLLRPARQVSSAIITDDPSSQAVWLSAKPFKSMPGPKAEPFIGVFRDMKKNDCSEFLAEKRYFVTLFERFGPTVRVSNPSYFGGSAVHTCDPQVFRLMLRNEPKYPSRTLTMEKNMKWIHEKMKVPMFMFFTAGHEWKKLRSAMAKPIVPRRVAMFAPSLYTVADELGNHWISKGNKENVAVDDIRDDLQKWALKGVIWFIYNEDMDVFTDGASRFTEAAVDFFVSVAKINMVLPLYKIFLTEPYKDYVNTVTKMHTLGKEIMKTRFKELQKLAWEEGEIDEMKISVMEQLMIEGKITEQEALSQSCDLLAAGVDTTSTTATFLLHEVAKRPDIQQALFEQISNVCGEKMVPDFDDLQKLSLVRNCVKETLRLHPVIPALFRTAESDMVINGYQVPKNTTVFFNQVVLTKDSSIHSNPETFDPYRWDKPQDETTLFASIPFGFGLRMCYGRRLAELELHLLLTNMIRRFILATDQPTVRSTQFSIVKPGEPVRLQLKKR